MGVYNATVITNAGQNLIASAIAGGQAINFTAVKTSTHVYPAGTALQNLTSLSDVKQTVAPTSVDVYNNNVVQISARVPNTGIATAYLINTIGLFGSAGGAETLIAVLTAQTPDEVPVFDAEAPAAFIFNIQMTIQNADEVVFEVNDTGTATVADLNRVAQPFSGATASAAGSGGRVPAPAAGDDGKFLRGDATWTAPADMVEAFTSSDVADGGATAWTGVNPLTSGETNKSIFAKMSQMFKNIRYLYKLLGTTNISSIGNGTVTNALSVLNAKFNVHSEQITLVPGKFSTHNVALAVKDNRTVKVYIDAIVSSSIIPAWSSIGIFSLSIAIPIGTSSTLVTMKDMTDGTIDVAGIAVDQETGRYFSVGVALKASHRYLIGFTTVY